MKFGNMAAGLGKSLRSIRRQRMKRGTPLRGGSALLRRPIAPMASMAIPTSKILSLALKKSLDKNQNLT